MKTKLNCILLVDDDEPTNYFHKIIITNSGCTNHVEVALNGIEALAYLNSNGNGHPQPDLILLDLNMPKMNGWEFMDEYKKLDKAKKGKLILVMLTTSLNPADRERAMKVNGVSAFMSKPFTKEMLQMILDNCMPN